MSDKSFYAERATRPVSACCDICNKIYTMQYATFISKIRKNKQFKCDECRYSTKKPTDQTLKHATEFRQKVYDELMADKAKVLQESYTKAATSRKARPEEEKAKSRAKTQATWANKSKEEMDRYANQCRNNTQVFWDNLDELGRQEMSQKMSDAQNEFMKNLTLEQREARAKKLRDASHRYWQSLSLDELRRISMERSERVKRWWASLNEDELKAMSEIISAYRKNYWRSLDDSQLQAIADKKKQWWANLSREQFEDFCYNAAIESNSSMDLSPFDSDTERSFSEFLSSLKIQYRVHYFNTRKHELFDKKFPINPFTGSIHISPYHNWDFYVIIHNRTMFIDIDGGIHYANGPIGDKIRFVDSQREYTTDGLEAYVIACPNDVLDDSCIVTEIGTDTRYTFGEFKSILTRLSAEHQELLNKLDVIPYNS